jgi:hypothetical protein
MSNLEAKSEHVEYMSNLEAFFLRTAQFSANFIEKSKSKYKMVTMRGYIFEKKKIQLTQKEKPLI